MNENNFISDKVKKYVIFSSLGCSPLFLGLIALFVAVLLILGLFKSDNSSGSFAGRYSECGFTISSTSLSKSEFKNKLVEFAARDSRAKNFAENADSIYDLCVASNINPELTIVRAVAEGYSPHVSNGSHNYWGIACYNGAGIGACRSYSSILKGVEDFIKVLKQWSTLREMMSSYAYIGDYWVAGSSASGGCYYFKYIEQYYESDAESQKSKNRAKAACDAGGTGIKTTAQDQSAYASYQISHMAEIRKDIFGLDDSNRVCSSDSGYSGDVPWVKWMLKTAEDNSVGYSMNTRNLNPNVDCSSFVYYGLLKSGAFNESQLGGYAFSTETMRSILTSIGFKELSYNQSNLKVGDILWRPNGWNGHTYGHTEVYIGDGKSVGAHSNYDGRDGDSKGNEVSVVNVSNNYYKIFRYNG